MALDPPSRSSARHTTRTLYRMIDGGELPTYKIGRVLRLLAIGVDAFTESCRVRPGELSHLVPARRNHDS